MADVPTFGHLAKIITRTVVREGARRGPEVGNAVTRHVASAEAHALWFVL